MSKLVCCRCHGANAEPRELSHQRSSGTQFPATYHETKERGITIIPYSLNHSIRTALPSLNTAPSVPYSPTLETLDSVPTLYTCSTLQHSVHLRLLSTEENSFRLAEVFLLFS